MNGEDIKKEGDTEPVGENLETLKSQLNAMKGEMEQLKAAKADLEKKLDDADKELVSPDYLEFIEGRRGAGAPAPAAEKEVSFDEMTPAQIAQYFESKYKGDLEKAGKAVTDRMDAIEDGIGRLAAQIDLTLTSMKYKDLGEALETPIKERTEEQKALVDKIYNIAIENPTWPTEKCYKVAKMEIKEEAEAREAAKREKAEKERKTLTEKPGAVEALLQGKQLSKEEAAEKAWRASFGNKQSVD